MSRFFSTGVSPVQFAEAERSNFKSRTTIQSDGVELQLSLMDMDGRFTNEQKLERARKAMTAQAQRKLDMIGKISKALGMDVVVHDYMRGSNGYFGEDGKIHFVLSGHMSVARVAAHELTHQMQSVASEKYTVVRDQLIEDVGQDRFDRLLKRKAAQYGYNMESEQGRLACDEEVIAELCEGMLSDKDRLERFAERHTDTALTLKDRLTKILNAIHATLKDTFGQNQNRISDMITDEKTADKWLDGLDEVLKKVQEKQQTEEFSDAGTKFSILEIVDGKKIAWVENSGLSRKDLQNYKKVAEYIGEHIGEAYTIIESGSRVYIGEDLPREYTQSEYTKRLFAKNRSALFAKNKATDSIGDMIEIAENRRWEKTKHTHNKDAKYGMYRYDTCFAFAVKNNAGKVVDVKAYDAELLIRNASNGKKYLYDIVNIKENTDYQVELQQRKSRKGGAMLPADSGVSSGTMTQNGESVKGKFSLDTDSGNLQAELYEMKNQRKEMLEADEAYRKASEQRRYANTFAERVAASRALREAQEKIDTAEIDRKISELQDRISKMREEEVRKYREEKEKYAGTKTAGYSMEPDTRLKSLDAPYMEAVKSGNKSKAQKLVQQAAEAAMPKSVVRDSKGKLLKTYHYTNSNFTAFDRSTARTGNEMDGFFFAPDAESTREYGERQIVAYLNITNLAVDPVLDRKFDDSGTLLREKLAAQGYDGVARTENGKIYEYMVLDPEQIKLADAVTYDDAGNAIPLSERFNMGKKDIRYALDTDHYDYSRSFAQQIDDYVAGKFPERDTFVLGKTPDIFQKVGLSALPMTMDQIHVDYALNGTKNADHQLGADLLKNLPSLLEKPVAIIESATHPNNSVMAIVKGEVNGKQVTAAVRVGGKGKQNGLDIDSNHVVSVQGRNNAITKLLADAVRKELNGETGIYYWNKNEALPLTVGSGLQLPGVHISDGLIHSIFDAGSPVNRKYVEQTETRQFKRWFGDWQNDPAHASKVVNEDGTPKVMYHGTSKGGFNVFNTYGSNFGLFGVGSYFTDNPDVAQSYTQKGKGNNPQVYAVYLDIRNPIDMDADANISEWKKTLRDASSYFNGCKTNEDCFKALKEYCQDEMMYKYEAEEYITDAIKAMGYDGITHIGGGRHNKNDATRHRVFIAFDPEQIKSSDSVTYDDAGKPIPVFERYNREKGDIRYSLDTDHYDYSRSFAQQIDDYVAGKFPRNDTFVLGKTPDIFQKVGLSALPMTMDQVHVDYALNGTKNADHQLGAALLKQLPALMENPVAIIESATHPDNSVMAIVKGEVNGKQVTAAVRVGGTGRQNGVIIDSNHLVSVQGRQNAVSKLLVQAMEKENAGETGVYYINKTEAQDLCARAGLQLPGSAAQDGLIHSIFDAGSPVNRKYVEQTETRQFKRWFGNSKVVDRKGAPRKLYHYTDGEFTVFDTGKSGSNQGMRLGDGIYLSTSPTEFSSYGENR
jgi:hypothetical protein